MLRLMLVMLTALTLTSAFAQTVSEKVAKGGELTSAELIAIFFSEVRQCQKRSQATEELTTQKITRIKQAPQFFSIGSSPDYPRIQSEAEAFVLSKGLPSAESCIYTMKALDNLVVKTTQNKK
jgi:hypothetical protein